MKKSDPISSTLSCFQAILLSACFTDCINSCFPPSAPGYTSFLDMDKDNYYFKTNQREKQ